ncbi:MAG: hypothetical protein MJ164_00150 [Alphaproteobacteria bacterium]|nr:hypothetical protein [Alphaproteobacteria bacterium]
MHKGKNLRKSKEKSKYRESKNMSKKHIFLSIFSKIAIFVCVFCAFFISPVFASLPAGYTELEYIESTGTQWIGITISNTNFSKLEVNAKAVRTGSDVATAILYGLGSNVGTWTGATNVWTSGSGAVSDVSAKTMSVLKTIWENGQQFFYVNDNYIGTRQSSSMNGNFTIFKGGDSYFFQGKLYTLKISVNDILTMHLFPARRNSDNVVGLYDIVSGQFFTKQGTGSFIAGPVAEIKIATTKMVDEEFAAAEAKLATTVQTIESVVSRTITQTGQIATLQETKQTRPDENCPANMKCLLVQDEDGTPHWYPIIEP